MKNRTLFFVSVALALALPGCSYVKAHAAHVAYTEYQDALAAGDMTAARMALLKLVHAKEDVPDYWIELGKLQLQTGNYREAYDAFAHAHELDRSNVEVLSAMAQLALMSGQTELAAEHADSLALSAPNNPVVTVVRGYLALKSGELDKADKAADEVLAQSPNNPFATILKSRVLISEHRIEDAIALLEDQHRMVPQDQNAINGLAELYRLKGDWRNVARIEADAHRLNPKNSKTTLAAIEALIRAGELADAARMSSPLLSGTAEPQLLDNVLGLWARYAGRAPLPNGLKLANGLSGEDRVAFANYYNRIGHPAAASALLQTAQLPVTHVNARWNAVLAQSLALQGRTADAKRLFDLVLDREPDQVDALRGRSALEAKNGMVKQAILDAQRLVTMKPDSGEDRIILAQAYLAAGNHDQVRRTLWAAFQDLPEDERVFAALKNVLASTGDVEGQRRLTEEFSDRRTAAVMKDLV